MYIGFWQRNLSCFHSLLGFAFNRHWDTDRMTRFMDNHGAVQIWRTARTEESCGNKAILSETVSFFITYPKASNAASRRNKQLPRLKSLICKPELLSWSPSRSTELEKSERFDSMYVHFLSNFVSSHIWNQLSWPDGLKLHLFKILLVCFIKGLQLRILSLFCRPTLILCY